MREIKFRAWDKDSESMLHSELHSEEYDFRFTENGLEVFGYSDDFNEPMNAEVMQYTGLKDKNGKEIYEGDIVEYGLLTGKIIFESGSYQFEILKSEHSQLIGARDCLIDLSEDGFEIIGNIYENPELLEGDAQ